MIEEFRAKDHVEFTAFMVPPSLVIMKPRHLVSSSDMKLCIALASSNEQTTWPLMVALTYMSPFFVGAGGWLKKIHAGSGFLHWWYRVAHELCSEGIK